MGGRIGIGRGCDEGITGDGIAALTGIRVLTTTTTTVGGDMVGDIRRGIGDIMDHVGEAG